MSSKISVQSLARLVSENADKFATLFASLIEESTASAAVPATPAKGKAATPAKGKAKATPARDIVLSDVDSDTESVASTASKASKYKKIKYDESDTGSIMMYAHAALEAAAAGKVSRAAPAFNVDSVGSGKPGRVIDTQAARGDLECREVTWHDETSKKNLVIRLAGKRAETPSAAWKAVLDYIKENPDNERPCDVPGKKAAATPAKGKAASAAATPAKKGAATPAKEVGRDMPTQDSKGRFVDKNRFVFSMKKKQKAEDAHAIGRLDTESDLVMELGSADTKEAKKLKIQCDDVAQGDLDELYDQGSDSDSESSSGSESGSDSDSESGSESESDSESEDDVDETIKQSAQLSKHKPTAEQFNKIREVLETAKGRGRAIDSLAKKTGIDAAIVTHVLENLAALTQEFASKAAKGGKADKTEKPKDEELSEAEDDD